MVDQGRTDPASAGYGISPSNGDEISGFIRALPLAIAFSVILWVVGVLLLLSITGN
ncbi:hypothetical protein ACFOKF_16920 [Sphingobium rhizovicinum]|uniref:Uncharacterized protein n=1 Tax=Sphingobium rhizovicinum TaxID=432308 RepID=A0ABV7NJF7_9SPHN